MSSVVIIEPRADGHRMHYVRHVARELIEGGHQVTLLTFSESLNHAVYQRMQTECGQAVQTIVFDDEGQWNEKINAANRPKRQMVYRDLFGRQVLKQHQKQPVDAVFLPYSDYCQDAIAVIGSPFGKLPWAGLTMRPSFQYQPMGIIAPSGKMDKIEEWLFFHRLLRNPTLRTLFTIDQPLIEYAQKAYPSEAAKMTYANEPVEFSGSISREEARRAFGIPENKLVILAYGVLDKRKGVDCLLAAFDAPGVPPEVCALFAGPQDEATRALLRSPLAQRLRERGQVIERDQYMGAADEYQAFRAADVVWMGYREKYTMSAVIIQAGMLGLPVIACREGIVGWLANRYTLGPVMDVSDAATVRKAIGDLAASPEARHAYSQSGAALSQNYAASAFAHTIANALTANSN